MVLDAWAHEDDLAWRNEPSRFSLFAAPESGERLVKPMTYMNDSGKAVAAWLDWLKLTPADVLVVVDDVALPKGQIRLRPEAVRGGHNGLKSIEAHLGTDKYARRALRGRSGARRMGVGEVGALRVSTRNRRTRLAT